MKSHKLGEYMKDDTRLALLEQSIGHINETMLRMEKRFDKVDKQFDEVDKRFDKVDKQFDKLDEKIEGVRTLSWSHFRWIMGTIIAFFGTLVTALIKGHLS